MDMLWIYVPLAAAMWLLVLTVRDARKGQYLWAGLSLLLAIGLISVPIPTHSHSVDIDLPGTNS
jgi:hypothetical protein